MRLEGGLCGALLGAPLWALTAKMLTGFDGTVYAAFGHGAIGGLLIGLAFPQACIALIRIAGFFMPSM